jgi:hypothetical protein
MTTIRYEVVYKNLIRSLRKFYAKDFKEQAQATYRRGFNTQTEQALRAYCQQRFGPIVKALGAPLEEVCFTLGSLIFPK